MIREPAKDYDLNWAKEVTRLLQSLSRGVVVTNSYGSFRVTITDSATPAIDIQPVTL